jgi:RNA polymerase sigma-70 factor (ECF subfamily)
MGRFLEISRPANPERLFLRLKDEMQMERAGKASLSLMPIGVDPPAAVVHDVALNSEEAFVRAFNEVRAELVSTLFFLLGNYADAQDAAQDAFLKCWRTRHTFSEIRNLRAWIFRVGLNAAKDLQRNAWRRRARPLVEGSGLEAGVEVNPGATLEEQEQLEQLRQALVGLRAEEKAVFLLRQNGDFTYEEIAHIRRCPVGTVKTQMRAAMQKLRQVLKDK